MERKFGLNTNPYWAFGHITHKHIITFVEAKHWKALLNDYLVAFGLYINYNKSKIYFFNADAIVKQRVIDIIGCQSTTFPGS